MDRIKYLLELYEQDSSDTFTQFALGFEYHKKGQLLDALRWYESILHSDPDYTGLYFHLGRLYVDLGRTKDAKTIYEKGIQICTRCNQLKDLGELQQALMELDYD